MALGKMKREQFEAPKLQITSMMDMFTIILIFLLFSFSDKPDTFHMEKDFRLPASVAQQDYKENIKLVLSKNDLRLEDELVASLKDDKIIGLDPEHLKESSLYQQLRSYREKADKLNSELDREKTNKPGTYPIKADTSLADTIKADKSESEGKTKEHILFFCDKRLPFDTINQIIKTAALAGYPNFQFAVLKK